MRTSFNPPDINYFQLLNQINLLKKLKKMSSYISFNEIERFSNTQLFYVLENMCLELI